MFLSSKTVFEKKCCELDFENWLIPIFFEHIFALTVFKIIFWILLLKNKSFCFEKLFSNYSRLVPLKNKQDVEINVYVFEKSCAILIFITAPSYSTVTGCMHLRLVSYSIRKLNFRSGISHMNFDLFFGALWEMTIW